MMLARMLSLVTIFLLVSPAGAQVLEGKIVAVLDGDTVTLLGANHEQYRIRLAQIDAPEKNQPFGQRSKQSLSDLLHGKDVRAECKTRDRYGRHICEIAVGSTDADLEQVRRGMAWAYRKYTRNAAYFQAENEAKIAKRGLWSEPNPTPPWQWRHRRKNGDFR
jgi:endonuclease YncB( thermonuclease family)